MFKVYFCQLFIFQRNQNKSVLKLWSVYEQVIYMVTSWVSSVHDNGLYSMWLLILSKSKLMSNHFCSNKVYYLSNLLFDIYSLDVNFKEIGYLDNILELHNLVKLLEIKIRPSTNIQREEESVNNQFHRIKHKLSNSTVKNLSSIICHQ